MSEQVKVEWILNFNGVTRLGSVSPLIATTPENLLQHALTSFRKDFLAAERTWMDNELNQTNMSNQDEPKVNSDTRLRSKYHDWELWDLIHRLRGRPVDANQDIRAAIDVRIAEMMARRLAVDLGRLINRTGPPTPTLPTID